MTPVDYALPADGLPALRCVKRELRARVAVRDDHYLSLVCRRAGITVFQASADRWDALAHVFVNVVAHTSDGRIDRARTGVFVDRTLASASDRTMRAAVRRLLEAHPDAVWTAATAPLITRTATA